jgi:hypothetical protein
VDKFEELVWPAFLKFCSENEIVYNLDNVTKNVVKVADGAIHLRKSIKGRRDTWVALDKEFVRMAYQAMLNHKNRITLGELDILYPNTRDLGFVFKVFSKLENIFRYEFREKRVYLK